MSENIQKKLAAVMFTYLVEYDKYFEDNEDYAIKVLNESKTFLKFNVIKYNGKIVKYLDNMSFIYFSKKVSFLCIFLCLPPINRHYRLPVA